MLVDTDVRVKAKFATELRDELETWVQGGLYAQFLEKFVPILLNLLDTPVSFIANAPEQVRTASQSIIRCAYY